MLLARLALAVALALTATTPLAAKDKAAKLEAAYVVMGAQGAVARAVYRHATDCPSMTLNGTAQAMNIRALPETTGRKGKKEKKAAFPVLVCELPIPAGTTNAQL